jgi:hypothetical protein
VHGAERQNTEVTRCRCSGRDPVGSVGSMGVAAGVHSLIDNALSLLETFKIRRSLCVAYHDKLWFALPCTAERVSIFHYR